MPPPFERLIGNADTAERLRQSLVGERTGALRCHAYLLTGPAQLGKRTLARAMASALVCTAPEGGVVPCGECRACRLVERGGHPDVRAVESEAGRKGVTIEQVRQLTHDAGLRPYEGARKVFILAEVEAMSDAAANALLKTLEEPPADTVLLLTSNDASQVLPTIASRCREVALRPVPVHQIEGALGAQGVEPETARRLARLAAGRPGWALYAAGDPEHLAGHIRQVDLLESLLGRPRRQRLPAASAFGEAAAAKDTLDVWLGWWRDALLVQQDLPDLVTHVDRLEPLRRLGAVHPPAALWGAMRRIQEARQQVDANVNVRLALETLLLDLPDPGGQPH